MNKCSLPKCSMLILSLFLVICIASFLRRSCYFCAFFNFRTKPNSNVRLFPEIGPLEEFYASAQYARLPLERAAPFYWLPGLPSAVAWHHRRCGNMWSQWAGQLLHLLFAQLDHNRLRVGPGLERVGLHPLPKMHPEGPWLSFQWYFGTTAIPVSVRNRRLQLFILWRLQRLHEALLGNNAWIFLYFQKMQRQGLVFLRYPNPFVEFKSYKLLYFCVLYVNIYICNLYATRVYAVFKRFS